jgi:hypothetical protein
MRTISAGITYIDFGFGAIAIGGSPGFLISEGEFTTTFAQIVVLVWKAC